MTEHVLDALPRRASEAISRRGSLSKLGAAALVAAVAQPAFSDVGKTSNKTKKLKKKKCKKQVDQCRASLEAVCQNDPVCEGAISCCGLFSSCNATDALTCIFVV